MVRRRGARLRAARRRWEDRYAWGQSRYEEIRDLLYARPRIGRGVQAYRRYYTLGLQHLAGSVTYFGVLALFPFLGLAYAAALTYISRHPQQRSRANDTLAKGLGVGVDLGASAFTHAAHASVHTIITTLGLTGLVYAGRQWVQAYRGALRLVWGPGPLLPVNVVWAYVKDVLIFLVFVAAMLMLVLTAWCATAGPYRIAASNGHPVPSWAMVFARIGAFVVAAIWGAFLCGALYHRLGLAPRTYWVRRAAGAAGLCLAGFAVGGLLLLRHAFSNPEYGLVAAMIGLMFWVSGCARFTLAIAVWAAGEPDPEPGREPWRAGSS